MILTLVDSLKAKNFLLKKHSLFLNTKRALITIGLLLCYLNSNSQLNIFTPANNGDFETPGSENDFLRTTGSYAITPQWTIERSSDFAYSGSYSLKLVGGGTPGMPSGNIGIGSLITGIYNENKKYILKYRIYVPSSSTLSTFASPWVTTWTTNINIYPPQYLSSTAERCGVKSYTVNGDPRDQWVECYANLTTLPNSNGDEIGVAISMGYSTAGIVPMTGVFYIDKIELLEYPIINDGAVLDGNGGITLNPSGGIPGEPYLYSWSDGFTGKDRVGLSVGTYTVNITQNTMPFCPQYYTYNVTIGGCANAPSVTDMVRCGAGTLNLTATSSVPGRFRWYSNITGGTPLLTSGPGLTSHSYTTTSLSTSATYYVTFDNGTCESTPRTPIIATVNLLPVSPTVNESSRCGPGLVTLVANSITAGTFKWYSNITGGTPLLTSGPGLTSHSYTTTSLSTSATYYVTFDNGTCESAPRTPIIATVNLLPVSPTVNESSRCGPGMVTLIANSSTAGTFKWYDAASAGNLLQISAAGLLTDSFTTPSLSSSSIYYVTLTNNTNCESIVRTFALASITETPEASTDFITSVYSCAILFRPTLNLNRNDCSSTSYLWDFGDGTTSIDKNPIHVYGNSGTYNVTLRIEYLCGDCANEVTVTKQITFNPTPATIENELIEVTTPVKNQVISASAVTFSDVWPLAHDDAALGNKSSYINGTQGVWRNNASYAYDVPRQQSNPVNVATDGTFTLNQFDWNTASFNVVPNWIQANTMTRYSPYSYELENQDVLGIYSAALYDYGGHLPSANGVNMRHAEMGFTSFEHVDVDKDGNPTGKPSGNWMLSNLAQPATLSYQVPTATGHRVVVKASLEELDLVEEVDISASFGLNGPFFFSSNRLFNQLQDVEILCRQVHPLDPKKSILVLSRAPFEGLWSGQLSVKQTAMPAINAVLDNTVAHSGKSSLRVTTDQTFRQEMFQLEAGKTYWVNAWVSVGNSNLLQPTLGNNLGIQLTFKNKINQVQSMVSLQPVGTIIEGWQQVKGTFNCPMDKPVMEITFKPGTAGAWYDDLRLQPEKGNMKAYVYNLADYRLQAILDEENYASFFYYDAEGNLYLTKKETERGIKTITENVSYQIEIDR